MTPSLLGDTAKLATLKAFILATPGLNALTNSPDGNTELARQMAQSIAQLQQTIAQMNGPRKVKRTPAPMQLGAQ